MIKLYGIPLSNYTNAVKTALMEKGVDFEYVNTMPSQDRDLVEKSPMGKIPAIETERGCLSETDAILDYIEAVYPEPALLPADSWEQAKVRELVKQLELYVELPARRGIGVIFGKEVPEHTKQGMSRDLPRGVEAVKALVKFSPWIAGKDFTYADLFGYYAFGLAEMLAQQNIDMKLLEQIPGAEEWYARVAARDSVRNADADFAKARKAMLGR